MNVVMTVSRWLSWQLRVSYLVRLHARLLPRGHDPQSFVDAAGSGTS